MIAHVIPAPRARTTWQRLFMKMLPAIQRQARFAFRHLRGHDHAEAIQATIADAWLGFVQLAERDRLDRAFPTTLVRYAVARVRVERQVGSAQNVHEVLSPYAQRQNQFFVERLGQLVVDGENWLEAVVEDHHTPVFDQVWFRIDFPEWLSRLSIRNCQIAQCLAHGHSVREVARKFRLSTGRVSQLRRELHDSWKRFQGEDDSQLPDVIAVDWQPRRRDAAPTRRTSVKD